MRNGLAGFVNHVLTTECSEYDGIIPATADPAANGRLDLPIRREQANDDFF